MVSRQRLRKAGFGGWRQRGGGCQSVVSRERSSLCAHPVERRFQSGTRSVQPLDVTCDELDSIERINGLTEPLAPGLCGPKESSSQLELPPVTREGSKAEQTLDDSELSIEAFVDT